MNKMPVVLRPDEPATRQFIYELFEVAVSSIVYSVNHRHGMEETIDSFRAEVKEYIAANYMK